MVRYAYAELIGNESRKEMPEEISAARIYIFDESAGRPGKLLILSGTQYFVYIYDTSDGYGCAELLVQGECSRESDVLYNAEKQILTLCVPEDSDQNAVILYFSGNELRKCEDKKGLCVSGLGRGYCRLSKTSYRDLSGCAGVFGTAQCLPLPEAQDTADTPTPTSDEKKQQTLAETYYYELCIQSGWVNYMPQSMQAAICRELKSERFYLCDTNGDGKEELLVFASGTDSQSGWYGVFSCPLNTTILTLSSGECSRTAAPIVDAENCVLAFCITEKNTTRLRLLRFDRHKISDEKTIRVKRNNTGISTANSVKGKWRGNYVLVTALNPRDLLKDEKAEANTVASEPTSTVSPENTPSTTPTPALATSAVPTEFPTAKKEYSALYERYYYDLL